MRVPLRVVATFVAAAFCSFGEAQSVMAYKAGDKLAVLRNGSESTVPDASEFIPLSWSSDARWLVLGKAAKPGWWSLALVDTASGTLSPRILDGAYSRPAWAPDGRTFVAASEQAGLVKVDVAGSEPKSTPLVPSGLSPSWSPNGGRIAFVGGEKSAGLWVAPANGASAHDLDASRTYESVSWSPDGRALAAVSYDKKAKSRRLTVLAASGKGAKELIVVDHSLLSWSPNGQAILCRSKKQWGIVRVADKSWKGLGLEPDSAPDWEDSQSVLGVEKGKLVRIALQTGLSTALASPSTTNLACFACYRGLVLDGKFASPFGAMPQPEMGQVRVEGTVESIDLEDGTLKLNVWSVTTPDHMELNLAQPIAQWVSIPPGAVRVGGKQRGALQATDFLQEGEVSLILRGARAGTHDVLPVEAALIPELLVSSATDASLNRTGRALEYDGVCMDTVVVPLLFPVAGKVNWSDSFLASRDGGARRHHGQDLMAPKMRPLVAAFDGTVHFNRSKAGHNTITLKSDDGWTVVYMHVNNDTPGTDDGQGGPRFAFAPGLPTGARVVRGQLIGFCGDSGNAESTAPHCHFELHDDVGGGVLNAAPSLSGAEHIDSPLYPAPAPTWLPREGEVRWDGQVTKVDAERGVLVVELIGTVDPRGGAVANTSPRQVYVRLGECPCCLRSDPAQSRSLNVVQVGSYISAFGKEPSGPEAMSARSIGIGLSLSE
ncbi:MAG: PD40 domain-containing protein [Armatimonadetes bacterium]|nr:PD40 domain-containing protein [Armatimonadota bacterium]